ncbi:MAG: hypothetical protein PUE98_09420 [Galactobacillus timonensis]|uniref:hypothetical protein n=1 Tax=Galactobacillus timonensis TaxID=2041840 RepID=UPI00240A6DBF|nr:hypothetical protein [Galactobacillus timonensis]MDD5851935.1 hypothetical protein [Galactobacillus timonensis]MDD6600664.1 hypothetical protein [Galactobacillus timonensis]MDD6680815.1 hypothetical protein [Galactobacillus timonensis]
MNRRDKDLNDDIKTFEDRHPKLERFLFNFVNLTLWASVVILTVLIITAPSEVSNEMAVAHPEVHPKSYYVLMYVESILGCIVITIPGRVEKKFHVHIPSHMMIPFVIFLYCAIFLGEVRSYYYRFVGWDTVLHFFSAGMLATLAYSIVSILNRSDQVPVSLSPGFLALFAFCFAVAAGAIWEIYEFTGDSLLGMNMQKWRTEAGVPLVGQAALADTMKDIIVDVLGAGIISLSGYFSMKRQKNWLQERQLKVDNPAVNKSDEDVKAESTNKDAEKKPDASANESDQSQAGSHQNG